MKRRDFLLSIAPAIFVPKLIEPVWKRVVIDRSTRGVIEEKWILNPEWVDAAYEEPAWFFDIWGHPVRRPVPLRFKRGVDGEFLVVPRHILVSRQEI